MKFLYFVADYTIDSFGERANMRKIVMILCLSMMTAGFSGCVGNDTEISADGAPITPGELPDDWPTYSVPSLNDLPICDSTTLGRLYYVESPPQFQVCKSSGWAVLDLSQLSVLENSFPSMTIMSHSIAAVDDNDGTWSAGIELEILALDVDGHISSLGVDLDLDGTVDVDLSSTLGLGTSTANPAHLSVTFSMPYEHSLYTTKDSSMSPFCHLRVYNVYALMLGDEDGGITTELVTVYPPNVGSNPATGLLGSYYGMVNGFNSYGILDTLQISATDRAWLDGSDPNSSCPHLPEFSITDHTDSLTSDLGENLVRIEITSANDIASITTGDENSIGFRPWIDVPENCGPVITFDGANENNPQDGDAWIISEATSGMAGEVCNLSSTSTVLIGFGASGSGFYDLAWKEVIVS